MKVIVIGSGLIGVATAFFLRGRGHDVTVLDRREGPGLETSFANGALLTSGMAEPWNAPGCWRVLLSSLVQPESALQLRSRVLPHLAGWGFGFLKNSKAATFERNARSNLRLAQYSLGVMQQMRQETGIKYGHTARGSLKLFRDQASMQRAFESATRIFENRVTVRRLNVQDTIALDPALTPITGQLVGAIHYEGDETGDAYQFCVALADHARKQGVEFRFLTEVTSLELISGQVTAFVSGRERLVADQYIVAAGSYSMPILRLAGIRLPVQPAKGYSVTFDIPHDRYSLRLPVIDDHWHAAVVPLEGAIRVAGTAEFAGYDLTLQPSRIRNLVGILHQILPQLRLAPRASRAWCGLRSMSEDGVPIIGSTSVSNLLVNTGHGHLGWTMAAGSGQLLANLISGDTPAIDPAPYSFARF